MPDGLWTKCTECDAMLYKRELELNLYTCPNCNKHFRIGSGQYIGIIFDEGSFVEHDANIVSTDPLEFVDEKAYTQRIAEARRKSDLNDAMRIGTGTINGQALSIAIMD